MPTDVGANVEGLKRLGAAFKRRRGDIRMTQREVADLAGCDLNTVSLIERAGTQSPRIATLNGIAHALGWTPDSWRAILAGGEPTLAPIPPPRLTPAEPSPESLIRAEAALRQAGLLIGEALAEVEELRGRPSATRNPPTH